MLLNEFKYIDGITIINNDGKILYTVKFDPKVNQKIKESILGKDLFDIFPNINRENSSLMQCMREERMVIRRNQIVDDLYSETTKTNNISIPIKNAGRIVGAIEISQELEPKSTRSKDSRSHLSVGNKFIGIEDKAGYHLEDIISDDPKMKNLISYAKTMAAYSSPVFIIGETGTGKELFAHGIHNASPRKNKPFVVQNCSAVPTTLFESIFFGTSKGSFTGSMDREGLFEAANGGTLFLDELHTMPTELQVKLLRAIETGSARRVGENTERRFDVRIIAATNIPKDRILSEKRIRDDLYYRLAVVNIEIPPLRQRKNDIITLLEFFIKQYNPILEKNIEELSPALVMLLMDYPWKGNVRELKNALEASMLSLPKRKTTLDIKDFRLEGLEQYGSPPSRPINKLLEELELSLVDEALRITAGNVRKAANYLEIPRQTLQQKMIKYSLKREDYLNPLKSLEEQ